VNKVSHVTSWRSSRSGKENNATFTLCLQLTDAGVEGMCISVDPGT